MEQFILTMNNVKTSYKKFSIDNISFKLKSGDMMGLIGGSGAGKSTLIKTLLGVKKIDSGKVEFSIDSKKVKLKSVIGYSPQSNALFKYLTLRENVEIFSKLYNVNNVDMKSRMYYLLKKMDLEYALDKKIYELSGGMQKRADLIISLINDPKVVILDEPFNGLDVSLQQFIWDILKDLASVGKIFIISSHMINDIQTNCNQIALLNEGEFYNTMQVANMMKENHESSLEQFAKKVFAKKIECKK